MALDSRQLIKFLQEHDELTIIDTPLDIYLEIPQLAYIEVKKLDSKALLFTRPICKKSGKEFDIPVLMNVFGSHKRLDLLINKPIPKIAHSLQNLLHLSPPKGIKQIFHKLKELYALRSVFPKYIKKRGNAKRLLKHRILISLTCLSLPLGSVMAERLSQWGKFIHKILMAHKKISVCIVCKSMMKHI